MVLLVSVSSPYKFTTHNTRDAARRRLWAEAARHTEVMLQRGVCSHHYWPLTLRIAEITSRKCFVNDAIHYQIAAVWLGRCEATRGSLGIKL